MPESSPTLVWFRQDLRLADNPALQAAIDRGQPCVALFVNDREGEGSAAAGGAARWWQHHALADLHAQLFEYGIPFVFAQGRAEKRVPELAGELRCGAVFWNRRYEPAVIERDKQIKTLLKGSGHDVRSFNASLLFEPHEVAQSSGEPFQVFSPFWRAVSRQGLPEPVESDPDAFQTLAAPDALRAHTEQVDESLDSLKLLPAIPWDRGFYRAWDPTATGAERCLREFIDANHLARYAEQRNYPDRESTSRLSPYLHHGQLSPRQIVAAVDSVCGAKKGVKKFIDEIGWREFSYHLLYHFPDLPERALKPKWRAFPWEPNPDHRSSWERGETGYPLIDAGMRELWTTGWLHNRLRMNVASFYTKHLFQPWWEGASWFFDTLVDADLASNSQGWQWATGCGVDSAPYLRVFNPITQAEKFDADGAYIRRWLPELAKLEPPFIHRPWEAPEATLREAGVSLGTTYPYPVVEHNDARQRAQTAFDNLDR
ncbi:MAG: cryptochrome/photolyase family protein [Opitutales bacterium]